MPLEVANQSFPSVAWIAVGNGRTMPPAEVLEGLRSFHFDLSAATADTTLGSLLNLVPSTRLMFGSDTPIAPERIIPIGKADLSSSRLLDDSQRRDIFNGTALRLLPRLSKAVTGATDNMLAATRQ